MQRYGWIACLLWSISAVAAAQCDNLQIVATTPTAEFEIHGDGTVTHKRTGLMWSRCLLGQSGSACDGGTASYLPWDQALRAAAAESALASQDDWRLPNRAELASLVEHCSAAPSLNTLVFPSSPGAVWTNTPFVGATGQAWVVDFATGAARPVTHTTGAYIRLVRTANALYAIGDTGPAGGIVFYDKGGYTNGWRYLEAAPRLWNDGEPDPWQETWGCVNTLVGVTTADIGAGSASTELLVDAGCSMPALIAAEAVINGYDDWFLPSRDELEALHDNLATHTNFRDEHGFVPVTYASSTELDETGGLGIDFAGGGSEVIVSKSLAWVAVRPIRAF